MFGNPHLAWMQPVPDRLNDFRSRLQICNRVALDVKVSDARFLSGTLLPFF